MNTSDRYRCRRRSPPREPVIIRACRNSSDLLLLFRFMEVFSLVMATNAKFVQYRITQRSEKEGRGDFSSMPSRLLTAALNPDVGLEELEAAVETDIDEFQPSIEELIDDENE